MVDHYRNLLSAETKYLTGRIEQYDKILNEQLDNIPETVIDQIRLVVGQSNLFINERFKQFSGLIDDCALKRGEKETKVEDLAGFWDMIYYQVEDLKTKYCKLDRLNENSWVPIEEVEPLTTATVTDGPAKRNPVVKKINKKKEPVKPLIDSINGDKNPERTTTTTTRTTAVASKKPVKSNFREFLMSKRKEMPVKSSSPATITLPIPVASDNRPTVQPLQPKQNGNAVLVKSNGTTNHSKIITISNGVTTVSNGHHRTNNNSSTNNCLQQVNGGQNYQNGVINTSLANGHHLNLNNGQNGSVCNGLKSPLHHHHHNLHTSIITVNHHGDDKDNSLSNGCNPKLDHNNKLTSLHNNHQTTKQLHVDINTAAHTIENLKLKNLSDLMTRSLTVIDDTNKEN